MVKKLRKNVGVLIIAIVLIFLFLFGFYHIMENAEQVAQDYLHKPKCSNNSDCREVVEGTLLDVESRGFSSLEYSGKGLPPRRVTFSSYSFVVMTEKAKEYKFTVIPGVPHILQDFDVEKLYVPSKNDPNFLTNNFYQGETVYIEIWHDKVTFIYLSSIVQNHPVIPINHEVSNQPNETFLTAPEPQTYDIAIATVDHPLVMREFAQRDFYGWSVAVGMIFCFLLATL